MKKTKTINRRISFQVLLDIFLLVALICAVSYVLYINFAKLNPYGLNSDYVNEISYRQASWEQKTLYPEGFWNSSESLTTRPVLLYWLFYGITGDFLLPYRMELAITFLIELALLYLLARRYIPVRSVRLLVPLLYAVSVKTTYMFSDVYSVFLWEAMITLLLRGVLRDSLQNTGGGGTEGSQRKRVLYICLICAIAFLAGYGTIKMLLWIYIPWCVVDIAKLLHDYINKKPWKWNRAILAVISVAALLLNALACAVFMHFHGKYVADTVIKIPAINEWFNWDVLAMRATELLNMLGAVGSIGTGMLGRGYFILKSCTVLLNVTSLLWCLSRKNTDQDRRDVAWYCLTVTGLVMVYLVFIRANYTVIRYYRVVMALMPLVCGAALGDWVQRDKGRADRWPCLAIGLGVICLFGVQAKMDSLTYSTPPSGLVQAAEYIEDNGYKYVTGTYWNAGVVKGYTNGAVEAQHSSGIRLEPTNWLINEHTYYEERTGVPNIWLLTDDEEMRIIDANGAEKYVLDTYAEKVTEIGIYNLYALTENPFTLNSAGLPSEKLQHKSDYPDAYGMVYQNAVIGENHELVSDGKVGGCILYGPYTQSIQGTYDITLHYDVETTGEKKEGRFDVALDTQLVAATAFNGEEESVTLKNVEIEAGRSFEARVWTPEGMVVCVQSIEYERVEGGYRSDDEGKRGTEENAEYVTGMERRA